MVHKITALLSKHFATHRIVFWHDESGEMRDVFDEIAIEGVQKVTVDRNEFQLRYLMTYREPQSKFLVYRNGVKPDDEQNWLLDLQLGYTELTAERAELYLQDLNLKRDLLVTIREHLPFFRNADRVAKLKKLTVKDETPDSVRRKMMGVTLVCEADEDKILFAVFGEFARKNDAKLKECESYGLMKYFWQGVQKRYAYHAEKPTVHDFLLLLFKNHLAYYINDPKPNEEKDGNPSGGKKPKQLRNKEANQQPNNEEPLPLNEDAYLLVNRWREQVSYKGFYEELSRFVAEELNIEKTLETLSLEKLLHADTYPQINRIIAGYLFDMITGEGFRNQQIQDIIDARRTKHFFGAYVNIFEAFSMGAKCRARLEWSVPSFFSMDEGIEKYVNDLYERDTFYRKFIFFSQRVEDRNILKPLVKMLNARYDAYLWHITDLWQQVLGAGKVWKSSNYLPQRGFYNRYVKPYPEKDQRVVVIVSDALRYEAAAEFRTMLLQEDRYQAEITPMLGVLPSYTQLGIAALLPHKELTIPEKDTVYADGHSTLGTENRTKVLQAAHPESVAISTEEFMEMNASDAGREFTKRYKVIYVFHNGIDKIGDDKMTEHKVFAAVEGEFLTLMGIIKHAANMNVTSLIVTADHGFLYQHNELGGTDFNDQEIHGDVQKLSRRFAIGKKLQSGQSLMKYSAKDLGFGGDTEVMIPMGLNRMRIQGSGSRYVHGGATLQEAVIPVIEIKKKRKSDVETVEVVVLITTNKITGNRFAVQFYQQRPVGGKILPVTLRAGFYRKDGKLISDIVNLRFDSSDAESSAREQRHVFSFTTDALGKSRQDIELRLESPIEDTAQYAQYRKYDYTMNIAFGNEFDD